jgi:crotonobetainyl-CoA:carnitine CoA-transferase CaiB-like acyl-CoA transferase
MHPLAHLRVLEYSSGLTAAYCGKQFALWGAEVVCCEPPGRS